MCQKCINLKVPFESIANEGLKTTINGGMYVDDLSIFNTPENVNIEFFRDIESFLPLSDENCNAEHNHKNINTNETCKYYTASDLNSIAFETVEKSFIHMNIASLNLHETELNLFLNNSNVKFNFIGISETGLKKSSTNNINIDGYNHEDCYTETSRGGTRIYVSEEFSYLPRNDLQLYKKGELESTFVEIISQKGPNSVIGCLYRHPCMDLQEFNILYANILEKMALEKKPIFLIGDFNVDLLKTDLDKESDAFLQHNLSFCLKPFIIRPTRVAPHSKTLIDNIFSNSLEETYTSGNILCSISDHLPQFLLLHKYEKTKHKKQPNITEYRRD